MAKAKQFYIEGLSSWAKVFEENRDMDGFEGAYQSCEGAYCIDVTLDKEARAVLKGSGSAKKGKLDDDDNFIVKFVRKHIGPFAKAGGAPVVVWSDGTEYDFEAEGSIGNGSKVGIDFEVYPTAYNNGTRLNKVTVIEHVPYVIDEDDDEVPV